MTEEHEPRWHWHVIREHLTDRPHGWRYWRCFAYVRGAGCRWRADGPRGTLEPSMELLVWHRGSGHGAGVEFTVTDGGSVKLALFGSKPISVWLKLGNVLPRRLTPARSKVTGIRGHLRQDGHWAPVLRWELWQREHEWRRTDPWWRRGTVNSTTILGRHTTTSADEPLGECVVPLPEGTYRAILTRQTLTRRYVRQPGVLLDRLRGPRVTSGIQIDIPGGIPIEGKGEDAWNCGLDGLYGSCCYTNALEAIDGVVKSVTRSRERYGGPHDLPRPMTVQEADAWQKAGRP